MDQIVVISQVIFSYENFVDYLYFNLRKINYLSIAIFYSWKRVYLFYHWSNFVWKFKNLLTLIWVEGRG